MLSDDSAVGERRRVWAGCHVDGFTDMAGGHRFRDNKGERMRLKPCIRLMIFIDAFPVICVCRMWTFDDVCPEYISFPNASID